MLIGDWLLIGLAAVWAGLINSVVGSGTLVTFPTLVWLGVPPITANISNNIGLVPGAVTAYFGSRDQIQGSRPLLGKLLPLSLIGGLIGAFLLVLLPESIFRGVIPIFILAGVLLVLLAPRIAKVERRSPVPITVLLVLVLIAGVYGGYFGAAQGVILIGVLHGIGALPIHESNAVKNALIAIVNGIASVIFLFSGHINWAIVAVVAVGSTIGALIGSRYGRLIPAPIYRAIVATIGLIAAGWFFLT